MKRGILCIGIAAWAMGAWIGTVSAAEVKIGVIDLQRLIETSARGKEFRDQVFKVRKEREQTLAAKQEALLQLRKDFQKKSFTMSDRARMDKEQEIRQKELEFKNLSESYRQEVLMEGRKLQTLMFRELKDIVERIGEKEKFTIIVDRDALLYAAGGIDITEKVIKAYDSSAK